MSRRIVCSITSDDVSDIEPRFVCKACGKRSADVRPHFARHRDFRRETGARMLGGRLLLRVQNHRGFKMYFFTENDLAHIVLLKRMWSFYYVTELTRLVARPISPSPTLNRPK
jgi:hypothetical protein